MELKFRCYVRSQKWPRKSLIFHVNLQIYKQYYLGIQTQLPRQLSLKCMYCLPITIHIDNLVFCYILLLLQSVCKTGRVVIAHEAPLTAGFGAEIASTIQVHVYRQEQFRYMSIDSNNSCTYLQTTAVQAHICMLAIIQAHIFTLAIIQAHIFTLAIIQGHIFMLATVEARVYSQQQFSHMSIDSNHSCIYLQLATVQIHIYRYQQFRHISLASNSSCIYL